SGKIFTYQFFRLCKCLFRQSGFARDFKCERTSRFTLIKLIQRKQILLIETHGRILYALMLTCEKFQVVIVGSGDSPDALFQQRRKYRLSYSTTEVWIGSRTKLI